MSINKQTLSQQIVQELKRRILEGRLRAGERIWAADLVEELDVSMAPVKDALIILQGEGLITNIPRRGAIVRKFSMKEVVDLFDMRAMVECGALEKGFAAGRINQRLIAELVRLNELLGRECSGAMFENKVNASEIDWQFHDVMIQVCDNQLLVDWYTRLNTQSQIIRLASWDGDARGKQTYLEHKSIINGLENGEFAQAATAVKFHLNSTVTAFRSLVGSDNGANEDYSRLRARRA